MKYLTLYYTPGARGDFLVSVLHDNIIMPSTFATLAAARGIEFTKLHTIEEYNSASKENSYIIRISNNTAKEIVDVNLLNFIKNKKPINGCFYDTLYITSKIVYQENLLAQSLEYSYHLNFKDFKNLSVLSDIYTDCTGKQMSLVHNEYINHNNAINQQYLDEQYSDTKLEKIVELLQFEIDNECLFKMRKFDFNDYLNSSDSNFLNIVNYYSEHRLR